MFQTLEEEKKYMLNGDQLCNSVKRQLGLLLMNERVNRREGLLELGAKVDVPNYKIELVEMGRRKFNWFIVARLLAHYRKQIEIRLVDMDK